jgi:S-adenosylmethionine decarboxylase
VRFSGTHLLLDLFECCGLDDAACVERTLRAAVACAGATLLDFRLHRFGEGQGVTAVALLAESHISIHSWPEHDYAAVDIFLCGQNHDLCAATDALVTGFQARRHTIQSIARGFGNGDARADR